MNEASLEGFYLNVVFLFQNTKPESFQGLSKWRGSSLSLQFGEEHTLFHLDVH